MMKISSSKIIQELLPEFIESGLKDFDTGVREIIENKNTEGLKIMAHSWKGAAAQYEFPVLAEKCKLLYDLAIKEDWQNIELLAEEILYYIKEINSTYEITFKGKRKNVFYKK